MRFLIRNSAPVVVLLCASLLGACSKPPSTEPSSAGGSPPASERREDIAIADPQEDSLPAQKAIEPNVGKLEFAEGLDPDFARVFSKLSAWVHSAKGKLNVALIDLETEEWLVKQNANEPVNVASNAKIVTAAGALELLGPSHQFRTELFGSIDNEGRAKRLVLRGGGAPDLSSADLFRLASVALGRGLSEVGDIVVDQSLFDENFVPPGYEQQSEEWAPFRANISALSLNKNAVFLNVFPTRAGEPARVWYDPKGVVRPLGKVETGKLKSGDRVRWNISTESDPQFIESKVAGSLAEGLGRRRYSRRLEDPRRAGGLALASILRDLGVELTGEVKLGVRKKEPRMALWDSEPLAELVRDLGKDSDNFVAEMLLVALSAAREDSDSKVWSSGAGAEVLTKWLSSKGVAMDGIVVKNGSGLFDGNRYSAALLVTVLAQMESNPRVFQEFVSQLATGATDGTLRKRMRDNSLAGRIRAKTGTLRKVISLSGYVQRLEGRSPVAFSVIVSGIGGRHAEVRKKVDAAVLKTAALLSPD